jgi:hypothetical protein
LDAFGGSPDDHANDLATHAPTFFGLALHAPGTTM